MELDVEALRAASRETQSIGEAVLSVTVTPQNSQQGAFSADFENTTGNLRDVGGKARDVFPDFASAAIEGFGNSIRALHKLSDATTGFAGELADAAATTALTDEEAAERLSKVMDGK
ncbi:hypothetical protein Srot_0795 [Segniliparus rotundus DSM 44985]|uniref:Uncharacterized protein n=1 Tax=Segniliparus rotundus (strain ATCC BAA-972 / CDC 1076 / CIP 108378 / DSM 44985 / JCM 13578) TaxID=640132 RepID=D6ZDZ4_SEGRD|nr:hypothetical protein [Segniliparus rotundus]ADG97274.1 hypothetical protein Srot_0795 [Segniliparus rotundus DSM 44985]